MSYVYGHLQRVNDCLSSPGVSFIYNYGTFVEDCLIGLFFKTGNNGTMQITQRINDSHYLCTIYYEGKPTGPKTIYSLNELGHFKLSTDIDGVE